MRKFATGLAVVCVRINSEFSRRFRNAHLTISKWLVLSDVREFSQVVSARTISLLLCASYHASKLQRDPSVQYRSMEAKTFK